MLLAEDEVAVIAPVRPRRCQWCAAPSDFIQSADTPTTGVILVIRDAMVVDARLGSKRGTLAIKNAAVFRTGR
jgi:hypothetical protein